MYLLTPFCDLRSENRPAPKRVGMPPRAYDPPKLDLKGRGGQIRKQLDRILDKDN